MFSIFSDSIKQSDRFPTSTELNKLWELNFKMKGSNDYRGTRLQHSNPLTWPWVLPYYILKMILPNSTLTALNHETSLRKFCLDQDARQFHSSYAIPFSLTRHSSIHIIFEKCNTKLTKLKHQYAGTMIRFKVNVLFFHFPCWAPKSMLQLLLPMMFH